MPAFFIVGSARSGTTLVRLLMNAHPMVVVPPESRFIVEFWTGEDTVEVKPFLDRLAIHPRFRVWDLPISDVAAEVRVERMPYALLIEKVYEAYARPRGKPIWGDKTPRYIEHLGLLRRLFPDARFIHVIRDGRNVALSYADVPFGPKSVAAAAELWSRRVSSGLSARKTIPKESYLEVRYEDLDLPRRHKGSP